MACYFKILLAVWLMSIAGLAHPTDKGKKPLSSGTIQDLLEKEKECENIPPTVLSKQLVLIHQYNDSQFESAGQKAESKFTLPGGLQNKIQNLGGVQKTVVNNQIQYNFYFWLLPKNFNGMVDKKRD